ncbi:MAG: hypothetical protein UX28_C0001G0080 [Candidatus Pacebacteria bacterium GW2011_GWA1_46_10]|nr:MAG: hypothetical protein UX28_C0001G0080 [Candidatus Pacebacteria bacterium GW2011_GWA1_46_10]HCR81718.1 hypothetical protein [Candidatus Paceibacterota bacterium]
MKQIDIQSQFKRLQQRKELLVILLFLFVIIIFWIALSVLSSQQTVGITTEQKALSAPLSPNLNRAVIEKLEQKKGYSLEELADFPVHTIQTPVSVRTVTVTGNTESESVVLPEELENTLESIEQAF